MTKYKSKSRKHRIFCWLQVVFFFGLVGGALFGFGDYYRQFTASSAYGRERSSNVVLNDTRSAIERRVIIGAGCGTVLGLFLVIRDMRRKERGEDDV
jgi:hypothetical protein